MFGMEHTLIVPVHNGFSINLSGMNNCIRRPKMHNSKRISSSYFIPQNGNNLFYPKLTPSLVSASSAMGNQVLLDSVLPFIPSFTNNRVCQFCLLNSSIAPWFSKGGPQIAGFLSEFPQGQNDFIIILKGYPFFHYVDICTLYKSNGG